MKHVYDFIPTRVAESDYVGQFIVSAAAIGGMITATAVELILGAPNETTNAIIYGGGMGIVGNCSMSAVMLAGQKKFNKNILGK